MTSEILEFSKFSFYKNVGDREIDSSNRQTVAVPRRDGMTTITDTLRYAFQAGDHGQVLRCLTAGPWLNMDDQHDAFAHLNVICINYFTTSA